MKVLFVNPHRSDFVYNSPVYSLIKRKNLKKYQYLDHFFTQNETDFYFATSSLFRILSFLKLKILDILVLRVEKMFFHKYNDFSNRTIIFKNKSQYDVTFCFGFSIRDLTYNQIIDLANKSKILIIHLSHYHLYAQKLKEWSKCDNVSFCADTNITDTYFYNYFLNRKVSFFILSYTINSEKFKSVINFQNRDSKIISTGTFHEFEKMYTISQLKNISISNIFGFLTIHPERRILHYFRNKLINIVIYNNSMGKIHLLKIFKKNNTVNQAKYFSFDIVELYNKHKYAFIGEESISGLPGIGIFEAVMCGCVPIINDFSYIGTPLENSRLPIVYRNMNHLFHIIKNFDHTLLNLNYSDQELIEFKKEVTYFFSESNQIDLLNKFISTKI